MNKIPQRTRSSVPVMEDPSFREVVRRVAAILLGYAINDTAGTPRLSQREMASFIGTNWEQVNNSLKFLQKEGAISIDRHRLTIRETPLRILAGPSPGICRENTTRGG
jgi:DNA-binding transcriptional regulator YhcF (GntR family)